MELESQELVSVLGQNAVSLLLSLLQNKAQVVLLFAFELTVLLIIYFIRGTNHLVHFV